MKSRCDKYSLKTLLMELTTIFSGISELHIFGSRRHRTMSTRSDMDLLLVADRTVAPEDVRDFALSKCPFLDCFFLERGIATSCANGSKVRGRDKADVLYRLDAIKLWDKNKGFADADVDWEFEVIKGFAPIMTTMISSEPFPSKVTAIASTGTKTTEAKGRSRWREVTSHPLYTLGAVAIATAGSTFGIIREIRIVPLEREIEQLQKHIDKPAPVSTVDKAQKTGKQQARGHSQLDAGPAKPTP
jgi:hypothetical protein